jgi:hypothetical protein
MRLMYKWLKQSYSLFRILSLDVVSGVVAVAYLWSEVLQIKIELSIYVALGLAVWLIYTLDHLLDAYKIPHTAHTQRHRFHQKYLLALSITWILGAACGFWIALQLPIRLWVGGVVMLGLVALHFLLNFWFNISKKQLIWQKETRIAIFYSLGVALGPLSEVQYFAYPLIFWMLLMIFGLAWLNLLLISLYESEIDFKDLHDSTAQRLGQASLEIILARLSWLIGVFWLLGVYLFFHGLWVSWILLGLMWFTLEQVRHSPNYFRVGERYRAWSDFVFLYPYFLYILILYGTRF